MTPSSTSDPSDRQQGAAAVEMALVTPLLLLILFGVLEFGVLFAQDLGIGGGAREGARVAATTSTLTCDEVIALTRDATTTAFLSGTDVGVAVGTLDPVSRPPSYSGDLCSAPLAGPAVSSSAVVCDRAGDGHAVQVSTSFDAELQILFGPSITVPLTSEGVFRCES